MLAGMELIAKLLLTYSFLMLKNLSGVWDHPGVPMALEGSPLLCMPDGPGACHL